MHLAKVLIRPSFVLAVSRTRRGVAAAYRRGPTGTHGSRREEANEERLIRTCGRGQPAANGVAEDSSRPVEAGGFPFDSFKEAYGALRTGFTQPLELSIYRLQPNKCQPPRV